MLNGSFITFEGIDGSGKTTLIDGLEDYLTTEGHVIERLRHPGGTPLGEDIRTLLLNQDENHVECDALMMLATMVLSSKDVIAPALSANKVVLCDRYTDSSMAYQCGGDNMSGEAMANLHQGLFLTGSLLVPRITILLDMDVSAALLRGGVDEPIEGARFEQQEFLERVRAHYLSMANGGARHRFRIIDATMSADDVLQAALEIITAL